MGKKTEIVINRHYNKLMKNLMFKMVRVWMVHHLWQH